MSKPIPTLNELTVYFNREDLINKVVEQIQKDFNWFSYNIVIEGLLSQCYN